ncbi:MAG: PAS domain S-box protein [Acidimicrobiia bacterium]
MGQRRNVSTSERWDSGFPAEHRALFDAVGDALVVVDAEQRIVVFNEAAQRVFGYQREEALGEPLGVLLPDRLRGSHNGQVKAFPSHGVGHQVPASGRSRVMGRRRDGTDFPAEVTLSVLEVSGEVMSAAVVRDVSARVATERALAESEERFRVAFEHSPVGMALVSLEGKCIRANQALAKLTGYPDSALEGMLMVDLIDSDDLPVVVDSLNRILSGDSSTARMEVHQHCADGTAMMIDLNLAMMVNEDGEPQYMIGQSLDITERVQSQTRLEELLHFKDELIASVSHELRTPLTALVGFAQLLHDDASTLSPELRSEMIDSIITESVDLTNIVEDLLVAAKAETGTLAVVHVPVNLRAQTSQVLEAWSRSEVNHVEIFGAPVSGLGDPARVRQILRNLVSNAIRYGGVRVSIRVSADKTTARVGVGDNGSPISPADQDRIFQPYQRAHQSVGVTPSLGLGLAVSRQLAKLMDGDLTYQREGDENVFELTLPRARRAQTG